MDFREGLFSLSESEYRPLQFLNASSIPYLLQSPAHYIAMLETPRGQTKEMAFGSATHCYILEPEIFSTQFVVKEIDGRTTKGKMELAALEEARLKAISEDDFYRIKRMNQNVKKHPIANKLLQNGKAEQVMMFELHASNGNKVQCKAKLDYVSQDLIVDLKTTKRADLVNFSKSIENYNYAIQGAMYSRGYEVLIGKQPDFMFIAVESEPPFSVSVIKLSQEHYTYGYGRLYQAVDTYELAMRTNQWPSYPERVEESRMSKWLR